MTHVNYSTYLNNVHIVIQFPCPVSPHSAVDQPLLRDSQFLELSKVRKHGARIQMPPL